MIARPLFSPARAALRQAVTRPIGGTEDACADSSTELFLAYALAAALERRSGNEHLRTIAVLELLLDVLTIELGADGADARLAALTPSSWTMGIRAVLAEPCYAAELDQLRARGLMTQGAITRPAQLQAVTPGGVA